MVKGHTEIRIKRVYDPPDEADGTRALVDRLWPRGLRKENAVLTPWLKEIAPSPALRKWFGQDPTHWARSDRAGRTFPRPIRGRRRAGRRRHFDQYERQ
jgi:uncharacterized protein YeaO (DUF488 family)